MEMTEKDYEDRKARAEKGEASDEDLRLIKHYERPKPSGGPVADTRDYDREQAETEADAKYADATVTDLKAQAKDRGLATTGTKDELVARLKAADADAGKQD